MNKRTVLLTGIIFLGFILRVWNIDSIPPGLNRDEASIGYTAYSLLLTGRDEYGRLWPLSLESFGDWKLPLYVYADIIPMMIAPLTEASVRIPSVIFGTLTVAGVYLLVRRLFAGVQKNHSIALLAALFLAVSPWHIHFSRVASEANVAVFLVCFSLIAFFKGLQNSRTMFVSGALLGLSLFTYHGNHVSSILLFMLLLGILLYQKQLRSVLRFSIPFFFLTAIILSRTLFGADTTKISGLTYFADTYTSYEHVVLARLEHTNPNDIVTKIQHNKATFFLQQFVRGYLRSLSPEFLFISGGSNLQHNIPNAGNLYIWEGLLIIIGLYVVFRNKFQWRWFLLGWLLLSPVAAAITKDAPHSARMLAVLPLPQIFAAVGGWYLWRKSKYSLLLVLVVVITTTGFFDRYYVHFPAIREIAWGGGYESLVASVTRRSADYSEIVMDRPDYSPYIYFLFYNRTDPEYFQKEVERYDPDAEGFHHVRSLGKMTFKKLDWGDDLVVPGRLLITWAESTPPGATMSSVLVDEVFLSGLQTRHGQTYGLHIGDYVQNQIVETIRLKNGTPQFYLIEVKKF